jgi:hypothetical protein
LLRQRTGTKSVNAACASRKTAEHARVGITANFFSRLFRTDVHFVVSPFTNVLRFEHHPHTCCKRARTVKSTYGLVYELESSKTLGFLAVRWKTLPELILKVAEGLSIQWNPHPSILGYFEGLFVAQLSAYLIQYSSSL